MLRIGLTGGIGSGKSTVAKIFTVLGIPVYYADAAAKRLMHEDAGIVSALQEQFGDIYRDGVLDKQLLAQMVFSDKAKLDLLNSIVHPVTIRDADKWMREQNSTYVIKEAALLFESGADKQLDYIVGVSAPAELRIQRAMMRDSISESQVSARISKQMEEQKKLALCHFVIINDEQQLLIPQVLQLHKKFLEFAATSITPGDAGGAV